MKKLTSKILVGCAAFAVSGGTVSAQVLIGFSTNDGSFEQAPATKTDFGSPNGATSAVPYWALTGIATSGATTGVGTTDQGVDHGPGGNNNQVFDGTALGFWQPGGQSTVFNLETSRTMVAGDTYTLTWEAYATGAGGTQVATLFSQAPGTVGAAYTYQPTVTLATADGVDNPTYALQTYPPVPTYLPYSLTYTATSADAGNYIGLTYGDGGGSYIAADAFNLSVVAAPEPSTYVLLFAGLSGLLLMRRFRPSLGLN